MSYAARILPALEEAAALLKGAGVPVSLERDRVDPPGGFLGPASTTTHTLSGDGLLRVHLLLVAPEQGDVSAVRALAGLLDRVLEVLEPDDDVDTALVFPIRGTPLPAWRVPFDIPLTKG